jgi:protein-disulfide isomerase
MPLFEKKTILIVTLAALALAGCNDQKAASDAPKPAEAAKPAETAATDAKKPAAGAAKPAETAAAASPKTDPAAAAPAKVEIREAGGTVDVAKLMEPGPLPEMVMGKAGAPVTIVEYMSMTCPHCANFHDKTLPAIKAKYVDTGKVRFVIREFPFDPVAAGAFMLARCSKDNYFPMVEVLFKQQRTWASAEKPSEELLKIAKLAGFTQQTFEACLTDNKLLQDLNAVKDRGEKEFGVDSTPTFFVNGTKYSGDMPVEEMSAIIDGVKP